MSRSVREHGFTLVEMMVVLAVLAITITFSLPYSRGSGQLTEIDFTARRLTALLREEHMSAISAGRERQVELNLELLTASVSGTQRTFELGKDLQLIALSAAEVSMEPIAAYRFFPEGGSTGGRIILTKGTERREIAISWLTGAVVLSAGKNKKGTP